MTTSEGLVALEELIVRLGSATGPSRELDAEIAVALRIGPKPNAQAGDISWIDRNFPEWVALDNGNLAVLHDSGRTGVTWESERYTSSIDCALTLVPEGWFWSAGQRDNEPYCGWTLNGPNDEEVDGDHNAPAMALCLAALKARQSLPLDPQK